MTPTLRMAAFLSLLAASSAAAPSDWVSDDALRGLKLDLEACVGNGCLGARDASDDDAVYLASGQAMPVRIRLHLDCSLPAEVRGIASLARVILVPAGTRTLHCPLEPVDAYCSFRFWEHDSSADDELAASFNATIAATPWPAAEDRVDEAELLLDASYWIPAGEYGLVAALPRELVDEYPCEELRLHPWIETPALRVVIVERRETLDWHDTLQAMRKAGDRRDLAAVRIAFDRLRGIAHDAPEALPYSALEDATLVACAWITGTGCEGHPPPQPPPDEVVEDDVAAEVDGPTKIVDVVVDDDGVHATEIFINEVEFESEPHPTP